MSLTSYQAAPPRVSRVRKRILAGAGPDARSFQIKFCAEEICSRARAPRRAHGRKQSPCGPSSSPTAC